MELDREDEQKGTFCMQPPELMLVYAEFLKVKDIISLACVCRKYRPQALAELDRRLEDFSSANIRKLLLIPAIRSGDRITWSHVWASLVRHPLARRGKNGKSLHPMPLPYRVRPLEIFDLMRKVRTTSITHFARSVAMLRGLLKTLYLNGSPAHRVKGQQSYMDFLEAHLRKSDNRDPTLSPSYTLALHHSMFNDYWQEVDAKDMADSKHRVMDSQMLQLLSLVRHPAPDPLSSADYARAKTMVGQLIARGLRYNKLPLQFTQRDADDRHALFRDMRSHYAIYFAGFQEDSLLALIVSSWQEDPMRYHQLDETMVMNAIRYAVRVGSHDKLAFFMGHLVRVTETILDPRGVATNLKQILKWTTTSDRMTYAGVWQHIKRLPLSPQEFKRALELAYETGDTILKHWVETQPEMTDYHNTLEAAFRDTPEDPTVRHLMNVWMRDYYRPGPLESTVEDDPAWKPRRFSRIFINPDLDKYPRNHYNHLKTSLGASYMELLIEEDAERQRPVQPRKRGRKEDGRDEEAPPSKRVRV